MNEAETRAELIDPKLQESGWITGGDVLVQREYAINQGEIGVSGFRKKPLKADYVLSYKNRKLAVIEAKSDEMYVGEGVQQAKLYAQKLDLTFAFATNGKEIYQICLNPKSEGLINCFPTPEELWELSFSNLNEWQKKFNTVPFESVNKKLYYYQEIAINRTLEAIANNKQRILLTLATGTGKTFIAFQIAWKLYKTRWNLQRDGKREPRILFLVDRNILANQAHSAFGQFPPDALIRITPAEIQRRDGEFPKNGSIFFTIFQTFMGSKENEKYFTDYERDFFDLVIIDECHRGGANDQSTWRTLLDHFDSAVHLGLTATPKRTDNVDTYDYFGEPIFSYSLKEGVEDGFLTPFKVKRIETSLDTYKYDHEDEVLQGNVDKERVYNEKNFSKGEIFIKERDCNRVQKMLKVINPKEKTIVFCAKKDHAAKVRDLINQEAKSDEVDYCVRVTSNDGEIGETYLRQFQDNERVIPTILTTSRKLATGVDVLNLRNIVIMRNIRSIIEFKQIIGRGTRLHEGKYYFTIIDFVGAHHLFNDPEWDGKPIELISEKESRNDDIETMNATSRGDVDTENEEGRERPEKIIIKLSDGSVRELQSKISTYFRINGKPSSPEEFLKYLFDSLKLPELLGSEQKLCQTWGNPCTRRELLNMLERKGCAKDDLLNFQEVINAENSDLFDVLLYIAYKIRPISRAERVEKSKKKIYAILNEPQRKFVSCVLNNYVKSGVDELDSSKISTVLKAQYGSIYNAKSLGDENQIRSVFIDFQKFLYLYAFECKTSSNGCNLTPR